MSHPEPNRSAFAPERNILSNRQIPSIRLITDSLVVFSPDKQPGERGRGKVVTTTATAITVPSVPTLSPNPKPPG